MPKELCSICKGLGFINIEDPEGCIPCPECKVRAFKKGSGLYEHEWDISIDQINITWGPDTENLVKAIQRVQRGQQRWLAILGTTGNGKTTSLMSVVNFFNRQHRKSVYYTLGDLMSYIRAGMRDNTFGVDERVKSLAGIPVMAIDEIDKANETDWTRETLHSLIDRRWRLTPGDENIVTVFAMNEEPKDQYLRSRLMDSAYPYVRITSPDVRGTSLPEQGDWEIEEINSDLF
jgi:DNA replication protein DnaC